HLVFQGRLQFFLVVCVRPVHSVEDSVAVLLPGSFMIVPNQLLLQVDEIFRSGLWYISEWRLYFCLL
ncbi:unnamed protein product, partial [Urochloa humidicola]